MAVSPTGRLAVGRAHSSLDLPPSARLSCYCHPLSVRIETPTKWRGGCSRTTV